jgi:hypothetical protein
MIADRDDWYFGVPRARQETVDGRRPDGDQLTKPGADAATEMVRDSLGLAVPGKAEPHTPSSPLEGESLPPTRSGVAAQRPEGGEGTASAGLDFSIFKIRPETDPQGASFATPTEAPPPPGGVTARAVERGTRDGDCGQRDPGRNSPPRPGSADSPLSSPLPRAGEGQGEGAKASFPPPEFLARVRHQPPAVRGKCITAVMAVALISAASPDRAALTGMRPAHVLAAAGFTQAELIEYGGTALKIALAILAEETP